jgi:hypothetical protein
MAASNITLFVSRGTTSEISDLPNKSIALDGYVRGPVIDVANEKFSFDHHDGCIRLVTRASCQQVMDALLLGLNPDGYTVYVNDVDGDTALAVWLLQNPQRVKESHVRELVEVVGTIDSHGPAYPTANPKIGDAFFQGAMKPVSDLHRAKKYAEANLEELLKICVANINALVDGRLEWTSRPDKERSYEVTHTGNGWVMAKSDDFIFDMLYADSHTKAIAYQQMADGSYNYTVGKKSELVIGFPVGPGKVEGTILFTLNEREAGWGGGSTIGGAPRNEDGSRSRLIPDEVFAIVQGIVGE